MSVSVGLVNGYVFSESDANYKESIYKIYEAEHMGKKWLKVNDNMIVRIENIAWISDENLQTSARRSSS